MTYFSEKQLFDKWVYWLIGGAMVIGLAPVFFVPSSAWLVTFCSGVLPTLLIAGFASSLLVLKTEVTDDEVHGALGLGRGLLHKRVRLADIARFENVTYNALDYGGWGFKGWREKSTINARGNRGVLLYLTNGDQVIVGSQEPDRLFRALQEAKRD